MDTSRRALLALGGSSLAGAIGGCLQFTDPSEQTATDSQNGTETDTPTPTPSVQDILDEETIEWLRGGLGGEEAVTFADLTDSETAKVSVGSKVFNNEFDPAAIRVRTGTTVTWGWTGVGGAHNVVSADEETVEASSQGRSDYEKGVGDGPIDSGDVSRAGTYEQTFDSSGTYRYYCIPHYKLGARGVVVVVES